MERYLSDDDRELISRFYDSRYKELGRSVKTVGWGNVADQRLRFEVLFRNLNPKGKRILDVGCGLGDLVDFLDGITRGDYEYLGIDLSDALIQDACERWKSPKRRFVTGDLLSLPQPLACDIAVQSGALSLKIRDNDAHARALLTRMFELAEETVSANFLSTYVDFIAEKNYHFSPETMFQFGKSLTPWVAMFHDYPLWEFTLQLHHSSKQAQVAL